MRVVCLASFRFEKERYYLSSEKKTIKPVIVGGIAGGHKYIAMGILFKVFLSLFFLFSI